MKKPITLILIMIILFTLAACGTKNANASNTAIDTGESSQSLDSANSGSSNGEAQVELEQDNNVLLSVGCNNDRINSVSGAMASDGSSVFLKIDNAVCAQPLDSVSSSRDSEKLYTCDYPDQIASIYYEKDWLYFIKQDSVDGTSDLVKIRTDGNSLTTVSEDFSSGLVSFSTFSDGWLYYVWSNYKDIQSNSFLFRISLDNGLIEELDEDKSILDRVFISDGCIYYNKGPLFDTKPYKMDLTNKRSEPLQFSKDTVLAAVYKGYYYYVENDSLYKLSVSGGDKTLILTSMDDFDCFNIIDDTICFFWCSSYIYKLSLDSVELDRQDITYIDVDSETSFWNGPIWLFDDQIWALEDLLTTDYQTYHNVTTYPVVT